MSEPLTAERLAEIRARAGSGQPGPCTGVGSQANPDVAVLLAEVDRLRAERREAHRVIEDLRNERNRQGIELRQAVTAEREACAVVCEGLAAEYEVIFRNAENRGSDVLTATGKCAADSARFCAGRIRER